MQQPPLISLCIITGNCEEYIRRCLTSFAPIADEIIVVRAIGNQEPDKTLEIAETEFGARTGSYTNAPDKADWPHVDDFAAARQMSFDMARGKYCFWCDTDDVLESGAELIRQHAERGEYAAYIFPYNIIGLGVEVPRERLISSGAGKWRYPVHECFDFHIQPVSAAADDRVVVAHMPHLTKTGSNERNLRILESIPDEELSAGLMYHLQSELAGIGRVDDAIKMCQRALQSPDLGKPEAYELWMNMVKLSTDPKHKETFLHEAIKVDPTRREAFGVLAGNCMDYGRHEHGLAYARQMMALPMPKEQSWNLRRSFYSWVGDDVYSQALRCNGLRVEAEIHRREALVKAGGAKIALIHATRGRPLQAVQCRKAWLDMADHPEQIEHIFVFDSDDEDSKALRRMHHIEIQAGGGCVAAWNNGVFATEAPVIVQLSDDWVPCARWDSIILERLGALDKPSVLAISDGHRTDDLLCMAICTRAYWFQDFFLFHPRFTGVFSDNYFTHIAKQRGAIIEARDVVFEHKHPAFGTAPLDDTYAKQNAEARYVEGKEIFDSLIAGSPDDFSTVPGFFNYWTVYRDIAEKLKDGDSIAEIGVWMGRSLIFMAQECKRLGKRVKLYAVDTFRGEEGQEAHVETVAKYGGNFRQQFEENIRRCGVADMVEIIEGDSAKSADALADSSLAFAYIDAAHDYESVKRDVAAWLPKVRAGGILAGHDADWHEVSKAVEELLPDAAKFGCVWMFAKK